MRASWPSNRDARAVPSPGLPIASPSDRAAGAISQFVRSIWPLAPNRSDSPREAAGVLPGVPESSSRCAPRSSWRSRPSPMLSFWPAPETWAVERARWPPSPRAPVRVPPSTRLGRACPPVNTHRARAARRPRPDLTRRFASQTRWTRCAATQPTARRTAASTGA